jgi:transposase InsO family protein
MDHEEYPYVFNLKLNRFLYVRKFYWLVSNGTRHGTATRQADAENKGDHTRVLRRNKRQRSPAHARHGAGVPAAPLRVLHLGRAGIFCAAQTPGSVSSPLGLDLSACSISFHYIFSCDCSIFAHLDLLQASAR